MRIPPGTPIPFWLRLWDGNPSRHVVAHLTDMNGVEQVGSPYPLTYSGNRGIYTASGPNMGFARLVADYETYVDPGHTQLDNSYIPIWEDVEPDVPPPPSFILLNRPLLGKVTPGTVTGKMSCEIKTGGNIRQSKLKAVIHTPVLLTGSISLPEIEE